MRLRTCLNLTRRTVPAVLALVAILGASGAPVLAEDVEVSVVVVDAAATDINAAATDGNVAGGGICMKCYEIGSSSGWDHFFAGNVEECRHVGGGSSAALLLEGVCRECVGATADFTSSRGAATKGGGESLEGHETCHADMSEGFSCSTHDTCSDDTLTLMSEVSNLLSQHDAAAMSGVLRTTVSENPNLVYRLASNTLELNDCDGKLVKSWPATDHMRAALFTD